MTRLTIDAHLKSQLSSGTALVELCDAAGNVVGIFLPQASLSAVEVQDPVDYAELERRLVEDTFISTEELLSRLERV